MRKWTVREDNRLIREYAKNSDVKLAEMFRRTKEDIRQRRLALGLIRLRGFRDTKVLMERIDHVKEHWDRPDSTIASELKIPVNLVLEYRKYRDVPTRDAVDLISNRTNLTEHQKSQIRNAIIERMNKCGVKETSQCDCKYCVEARTITKIYDTPHMAQSYFKSIKHLL